MVIALTWMVIVLGDGPWTTAVLGQQYEHLDNGFRQFRREQMPTPGALLGKLGQLQGVQLPASPRDQLMKLGRDFLSSMSPEDQQRLIDAAKQFANRPPSQIPAPFQDLARALKLEPGNPEQPGDLAQALRRMTQGMRDSGNGRQASQSDMPSGSSGSVPGPTPDQSPSTNSGRTDSNSGLLPEAWKRLGSQFLPGNNRQTPSSRGGNGTPESAGNSTTPSNNQRWAERITERMTERLRSSVRENENLTNPNLRRSLNANSNDVPGEAFQSPRPNYFQIRRPESTAASDNGDESREYIGNRFDRMIMQAVKNGLNDGIDSRSGFAESFNNLFSKFVDRFKNGDHGSRDQWFSGKAGKRIRQRINESRSSSASGWNFGGSGFSGTGGLSNGLAGVGNFLLVVSLLFVAAVAIWFVYHSSVKNPESNLARILGLRFRLPAVKNTQQLIVAMDGFLLSRFGKPASWWHSRRAERALNSIFPSHATEITQLVDGYEFARYALSGSELPDDQLQECVTILKTLDHMQNSGDPLVVTSDLSTLSIKGGSDLD